MKFLEIENDRLAKKVTDLETDLQIFKGLYSRTLRENMKMKKDGGW